MVLPEGRDDSPSIVLVHGAANSAVVWKCWQKRLAARGVESHAVDLRGHGKSSAVDLASVSMADYVDDVRGVIVGLAKKPVVMGWSMGGLVAMMVAASGDAIACVALAPSTPTRARDPTAPLRPGTFGAEFYGITSDDPDKQAAMPDLDRGEREIALSSLCEESQYARDDRKAGIVIEADRLWPRNKYDDLWLNADRFEVEGASHWGLVLSRRAIETAMRKVLEWVSARLTR
jgi:pimeloyl-ACP methyl ester carboxylesterase